MAFLTVEYESGLVDGYWATKELAQKQVDYFKKEFPTKDFFVYEIKNGGCLIDESLIANADWYKNGRN
jgi:hypothetical protein